MDDPRIGTLRADGSIERRPAQDITGHEVVLNSDGSHAYTVYRLDDNRFVYLPFKFNRWELVEQMKGGRFSKPTPKEPTE